MAYEVNKRNGDAIIVEDGTINTDTTLWLLGKNFAGYGEYIAEDLVWLLENFASDGVEPTNPTLGQIWFDYSVPAIKVYGLDGWTTGGFGDAGPLTINDTNEVEHVVTGITDEGSVVAIVSAEPDFPVSTSDPLYTLFPNVGQGITMSSGGKFHGTATTAEYADLAENYVSDDKYVPGTVLRLGGSAEVTQTASPYCSDVYGVVSTDPAYLMNSACSGVAVALTGRVPCRVIGTCKKGDRLVSSDVPGVAMVGELDKMQWYNQVGRALEDKNTEEEGLIEIVVGAK